MASSRERATSWPPRGADPGDGEAWAECSCMSLDFRNPQTVPITEAPDTAPGLPPRAQKA
jgi:hypothetical protein